MKVDIIITGDHGAELASKRIDVGEGVMDDRIAKATAQLVNESIICVGDVIRITEVDE